MSLKHRITILFCVPKVVTIKWVSLSIFPWTQSNLNLEIKRRLGFNIWNISDMDKVCEIRASTLSVSLFEAFASNRPFICNYHHTIKQWDKWEIFCEGLRWICKLLEINAQQDFYKPVIFSISSKHFIIEIAQGNSCQFCFKFGSGVLCFFPLIYNGNNLSVKLLKALCQHVLFCKL